MRGLVHFRRGKVLQTVNDAYADYFLQNGQYQSKPRQPNMALRLEQQEKSDSEAKACPQEAESSGTPNQYSTNLRVIESVKKVRPRRACGPERTVKCVSENVFSKTEMINKDPQPETFPLASFACCGSLAQGILAIVWLAGVRARLIFLRQVLTACKAGIKCKWSPSSKASVSLLHSREVHSTNVWSPNLFI